jgi:hypothetical protein
MLLAAAQALPSCGFFIKRKEKEVSLCLNPKLFRSRMTTDCSPPCPPKTINGCCPI